MRFSEQYGLRWRDVDFERKLIAIPLGKSGKREHISLNSSAIGALIKLRARLAPDKNVDDELVCSSRTEWGAQQWFKQAVAEAAIAKLRWHDLRHTFTSRREHLDSSEADAASDAHDDAQVCAPRAFASS